MLDKDKRLPKGDYSKIFTVFLLFPAIFFYFSFFSQVNADSNPVVEPVIKDVLLNRCQESLCLNFTLKNGLPLNIEKILQSGIPVKYQYEISLKKRRLLWDDELKHIELHRTMVLDNIRDEYVLTFYYPSTRIITVSSLNDARKYMFRVKNLPIIALEKLEKGQKYSINIRASARKGETSMPFGSLVKMFSSFDFSTEPYEIEFRY